MLECSAGLYAFSRASQFDGDGDAELVAGVYLVEVHMENTAADRMAMNLFSQHFLLGAVQLQLELAA